MLDHFQSSGFFTSPRRTGFKCMYSTFSWYSLTVRNARSKKRSCHSSPVSLRTIQDGTEMRFPIYDCFEAR